MTDFLFRVRIALLTILIVLSLGAAAACAHLGVRLEAPLELCAALFILAAAAFLLLRHIGLAAVALLAPLAGWPVALLLAAVFVPDLPYLTVQALALLPGFFIAAILAAWIAARIAEGRARDIAARDAMRGLMLPLLCALVPALGVPVFVAGSLAATALIAVAICAAFALLAVPLAASLLPFGEDFVARFNRVHEMRLRMTARLAPLAEPRWGWSVSGIAVVLLVLGYFGTVPHTMAWSGRIALGWLVVTAVLLAAATVAMRDWRRVVAMMLCYPPLVFLSLWPMRLVWTNPDASLGALQILAFGATVVFATLAFAAMLAREDRATASVRALEQYGAAIAITTFAAALAAAVLMPTALPLAPVVLIWGAGALVFPPAFTTALENLFPTRETIAARYKVG